MIFVPESAKKDLIRICFQIEAAHWFYLDFYVNNDPQLKTCTIYEFAAHVFQVSNYAFNYATVVIWGCLIITWMLDHICRGILVPRYTSLGQFFVKYTENCLPFFKPVTLRPSLNLGPCVHVPCILTGNAYMSSFHAKLDGSIK